MRFTIKNNILSIFYITIALLQFNFSYSSSLFKEITQKYKNVSVLVTGGCGFIGSHIVEKLVACGADVTVLDNLSTGSKNNIISVEDKITYINGDITDFNTCLLATSNKSIIFHLAAFVSVPASTIDPRACHLANVTGTQNLLEAARINNVKRFVFSSSCAVYGESAALCSETTQLSPASPYGFSKLIGEIYCADYAHSFDMETVAMRYFNVYGPRQNPHGSYAGVIAKFSYNMEHNLPLVIFGDGLQTRDFVSVDSVVKANLLLGMCDKKLIQAEVFNIASGKSVTLLEIIDELKKKYKNYEEDVIFMPARPGDVKHVAADCSKYNDLKNILKQQSYNYE